MRFLGWMIVWFFMASPAWAKTYYELLEIQPSATQEEIKTAYRRMSMKLHPDCNPNLPREVFQNMKEAYEKLHDSGTRAATVFKKSPPFQRAFLMSVVHV